jgi:hypothetical protein
MRINTLFPILVLFSTALLSTQAQVEQQAATAPATLASAVTLSQTTAYSPIERGRDQITWERYTLSTNRTGQVIIHTNRYVELQTGKHYLQNGQWLESSEEIQIVANGAVATNGPHKVAFTANINSPAPVTVLTPDNKLLKIRPLGLAYYDFHARTNIMIAELKDSDGLVVGTNQVLYPDAFTDFTADVRYTYTKSGLEQDVILRQRPPLPEAYGLNPATTWLLILTEFIDPPADVQVARQIRRGWKKSTVDKVIRIGGMSIGQGTAFGLGLGQDRRAGVPVEKHWAVIEGRTFLIEEVSFRRIVPQLRNLQASVQPVPGASSTRHLASKRLALPPIRVAGATVSKAMQIASAPPKEQGLVLDFPLASGTGVVLQGDTTYHVTGTVNLTNAIIEGGTVVKYDRGAAIHVFGPVQCLTGPYRPAVFTAVDDNSVGESIGTNSPTGRYADCALSLVLGGDLKYVNIRYAKDAIYCVNNDYSVSHAQLLFCDVGFHSETANFTNCNILMFQVLTNFYGSYFHGRVEHLTSDQAVYLLDDWNFDTGYWCSSGASTLMTLVNSITAAITNGYASGWLWAMISTSDHVVDYPSGDGVFQTVGAASHYLADQSPYRNAGTTNIDSTLLGDLRKKTTYPPIVYSNVTISADLTFAPQAQRDTDVPDLGYHYDPIDCAMNSVGVTNATLTLVNGAVIAVFGGCGLWFGANGALVSEGTPANLNHIVRFNCVQEQPVFWNSATYEDFMISGDPTTISLHFTDLSILSEPAQRRGYFWDLSPARLVLRDSQVRGGGLGMGNSTFSTGRELAVTNTLFERVYAGFTSYSYGGGWLPLTGYLRNNLFVGGSLSIANYMATGWNAFDNQLYNIKTSGGISNVTNSHNCYINTAVFPGSSGNDVTNTAFTFLSGPLGNYYQPTDSPLVDAGSVSDAALVGLYHYTTQTNQVKETNSIVDIGFHYVAVDSSGNPIDTNGDGLPDYLSDANGNGVVDSGEIGWNIVGDLGLRVLITRPKNNSTIP